MACRKVFGGKNKAKFDEHVEEHKTLKDIVCPYKRCNARFERYASLRVHFVNKHLEM